MKTSETNVLAVIPARYDSKRLPGKPLVEIGGKSLVERVWTAASEASRVSRVVVATDDLRIAQAVEAFGGEALMTPSGFLNGSERVCWCASTLAPGGLLSYWSSIVNIQADMPFISAQEVDASISFLEANKSRFTTSTLAVPITSKAHYDSPDVVKVAFRDDGRALLFSRAPIPWSRDGERFKNSSETSFGYKHLGIYAFLPEALAVYQDKPPATLEKIEILEQLRLLENGHEIGVKLVGDSKRRQFFIEVDTEEGLREANVLELGSSNTL